MTLPRNKHTMQRHNPIIILGILLLCTTIASQTLAEEKNANVIDIEQIKSMLGDPEKTTSTSSDSETWEYGSSKIFIRNGRVIAWSDNGELEKLAEAKKLRAEKTTVESKETQNWINPWTPPKPESREETIHEMIP